jgi:hypothetical protein
MTARKNQPQPLVFKKIVTTGDPRRTPLRFEISREVVLRRIESCPSAQSIDGFESGRRNQPRSRVAGYSTPRPEAQRRRKGFVHRLLGKIKIAEQADQSGQDSSRIHAIKGVEQFSYLLGGTLGHDTLGHHDDISKPVTPNQFGKRWLGAKCPEAFMRWVVRGRSVWASLMLERRWDRHTQSVRMVAASWRTSGSS